MQNGGGAAWTTLMNALFTTITVLSAIAMIAFAPNEFLPSVLDGGKNALQCALTLFCIYAFWMGLSCVAEDARICDGVAKLLKKPCRKLFKTADESATKNVAMNVTCNLLGVGGAATPFAVAAIADFERTGNTYAQNLLYVINATSLQIIPATVIALRAATGSTSPHDIALPCFISSAVCTALAVGGYFLLSKVGRK